MAGRTGLELATPGGLEPPTFSLEGCCSIQLSYGAVVRGMVGHAARRNIKPISAHSSESGNPGAENSAKELGPRFP